MLVQKLVDTHVTTAHSNLDLVLLDSHIDSLSTELVDTFSFSHEHEFKFVSIRIVVNELSHSTINEIILQWNVDGYSCLQVDNVVFELNILQL